MQAAQLRQQQSIGWKGRWGGPRLFLKECQRNLSSVITLKYARIWKGLKLHNEPYPLIITNPRFVQDLKVCFTNPQPGRAMTSRSHLPSLSGNKLDYHPLPAGSPLLSLYDKCFPCFMTRSTASGSGMTGPRSGTRPPGGSWSTTTCKSWRKARQLENQRDANIPRSYPTLAERKIVTSTLDSSTPLLALNMRPVVSMLIISFNKSTTPLFQKKKINFLHHYLHL